MTERLILISLLLLFSAPTAAAQVVAVTLAEAIRRAERVQPLVVQAAAGVHTAGARRRSAWGAFLPNLSVGSSASNFFSEGAGRVDPVTGQITRGNTTNQTITTSLSASVDLFTGFRRTAEMRAAKATERAAEASLVDARFEQALATTNQFFDALAADQLLKVRESSVRRAEQQLNVSVAKLRAGSATRSDSLRSLVTLGSARLDLLITQVQLASAEANLARLIGEPGRVKAADDQAFYRILPAIDTQALRVEAESKSPRIQSAVASAAAARAEVGVSKSEYWPSLTLGGSTSWDANREEDYDFLNQRQLSLALRWNLFNGFARELSITQREGQLDLAEASASDAKLEVQAALTSRLAELEAGRARIDISEASVAAATEDLRVQQERYRLGVSTIVDLLTSQEALDQAEVDVVAARYDYLLAKARLEALIGRQL